jgi:hypothetical protein
MAIPLPMSKTQLTNVAKCYATVFPGWEMFGGVGFFRIEGPIRQQIAFEALPSGAYRPSCGIRALSLPSARMLFQHLDVRHRQVLLRQHESRWGEVVAAMEQQFSPAIRKPIDLDEVVSLCEREARNATNDLAMLAILYAWLGRNQEAIDRCQRMEQAPAPTLAPRLDWERRHIEFGRDLVKAIAAGKARQFIETASNESAM